MKKLFFIISLNFIIFVSNAQINEIGLVFGGNNYSGDIGSEYYIYPNNLMGGLIYKWNVNPRMAFRGTFLYAKVTADDANSENSGRKLRGFKFSNSITEIAVGMEYNYFDYNLNEPGKRFTPYIYTGVGMFFYSIALSESSTGSFDYDYDIGASIPFGLGIKTKLVGKFAIAFETRATYTFSDKIDYNNYEIDSLNFGNPNTNDWYMFTSISLVYTFGRPPCFITPPY